MANKRKAFHFDLDQEKLKAAYPASSPTAYTRAWGKIRAFMQANGFEHTQYSGYESAHAMTYYQAFAVIENLQTVFPWFVECAQAATITEIGQRHDVLRHLSQHGQEFAEPPSVQNPVPHGAHGEEAAIPIERTNADTDLEILSPAAHKGKSIAFSARSTFCCASVLFSIRLSPMPCGRFF